VIRDPDETLVERCRGGDRQALSALMERYQRAIYNAAYRVLGNGNDAADVTQTTFLKVAERLDEYDSQYKFFSWIYRIAINESLNTVRRDSRDEPLENEDELHGANAADPERKAYESELAGRVQLALMAMRFDHRIVITLRHFSDCSYGEIAWILDLQEKTVKSRLFEARQKLRELLKDFQPA
jgi:RNA polymerase sigma-70 factor (ECF subfamily)